MNDVAKIDTATFSECQDKPLALPDYFGPTILVAIDSRLRSNANNLLTRVNRCLSKFGQTRRVVRGYAPTFPPAIAIEGTVPEEALAHIKQQWEQQMTGAALILLPSKHQSAEAVDLADPDGDLDQWLLDNQKLLESCGLWIEHPATTRGHCHLQSVPPKGGSRRRVFYP